MEKKTNLSKKDLKEKVSDLLNTFVKSMITIDTKKIKKSIKQASKTIAKSLAKSLKENLPDATLKKASSSRKIASRKSGKKIISKPFSQNITALLKNKKNNLTKDRLSKSPTKKSLEQTNQKKSHKLVNQLME